MSKCKLFDNFETQTVSMEMLKPEEKDDFFNRLEVAKVTVDTGKVLFKELFENMASKDCKKLFSTIPKWHFEICNELDLPVYKINSQQCFLIKENSNASIKFSNLLIAFESAIKRRDIASVRRLSGVQGFCNGRSDKTIPNHYYKDYTFTYNEVRDCLIKLLTFSLLQLDEKMFLNKEAHAKHNFEDIVFEINKYKRIKC